ncbi:hypothetical protein C8J57DRAFT_1227685 [Mycena rebaudengoi]|nr:hypothetical protein C8J57DRAFT_1227685 [Mycena rebaudengoi]
MQHVQKAREDIASDGSRIEGSHKGWNSIQRLHIKPEPEDDSQLINEALDPEEHEHFMQELKIDTAALLQPLKPPNLRSASPIALTHMLGPTNPSKDIDTNSVDIASSGLKLKQLADMGETSASGSHSAPDVPRSKKPRVDAQLHPFFAVSASHPPQPASVTAGVIPPNIANLKALSDPLPRPLRMGSSTKLTRSQYLFSAATSIDPRSLKITSRPEFFLFMDMRSEFQWRSFSMTPTKWVTATVLYNERLLKRESDAVQKNPRALSDKFGEAEPVIVKQITNSEYKSKAGSTKFWEKHCAVSLVKTESNDESVPQDGSIANAVKQRKPQTCTRCKTIKFPGPAGSPENHKKASCSDGFKPTLSGDIVPIWPLPSGIFTTGTKFHPLVFLAQVRELYQRLVLDQLVKSRVVVNPDTGAVLFRMFKDFDIPAGDLVPDDLIVEYDGKKHLYISSLVDTDLLTA